MIILDANILVVDLGYSNDVNFVENRRFLTHLAVRTTKRGMMVQGLLEVVGKRSFNTSARVIAKLPAILANKYSLEVFPDPVAAPDYAGCTFSEILTQMTHQMSLGDSIMAIQIAKFTPNASALITWDAGFQSKIAIPVLTPTEWLAQQKPAGPTP